VPRPNPTTATALTVAALCLSGTGADAQTGDILGHRIHGTGPETVIVLHDWLGSAATWEPILPYLDTEDFTFVLADVRGYGASIDMTGAYTTGEIAADVFALTDSLDAESFHLVGHSMTGMAGFAALASPEGDRIESYIAVTPVPPSGYPADAATRDFFAAIPHDPEVTQSAFDGLTGGRYEATGWAKVRTAHSLATSSEAAMRGYGEMIYEDLSGRLAEAAPETPVLVVAGAHDLPPMQPDALEDGAAGLVPNGRVIAIAGAGHYPMIETPLLLAQIIQSYLAEHID